MLGGAVLLAILAAAAAQSDVLPYPPRVINATKNALVFEADVQCPPNCGITRIVWHWKRQDGPWISRPEAPAESPMTLLNLLPGTRYQVRALLVVRRSYYMTEDAPVTTAYTCSDWVPVPRNLTLAEVGTDYFLLKWHSPEETCASITFYFQKRHYRSAYGHLSEDCPPGDLVVPQPAYNCSTTKEAEADGPQCVVRFEGIEPGDKYSLGVLGVHESGQCGMSASINAEALRKYPFGLTIGTWSTLLAFLLVLSASVPCVYTYWKKKTGRSLFDESLFTQMPASAANGGNEIRERLTDDG